VSHGPGTALTGGLRSVGSVASLLAN